MSKVIRCRDAGFDCDAVVRAETEEEAMQIAAAHARAVHHVEVTPEVAEKVRSVMHEEADPA